jgi:hypothetical protein
MTGTIDIGQLPFTYRGRLASGELVNLWTISDTGAWTFHYPIDPLDASLANFGITSSADELNILDGVTSTAAELNLADNVVASVSWAVAAGAANVCHLTGTLKDAAGATIAASRPLFLYISEAATGIGITADTYSTGASITVGTQLVALTANKAWLVNTHTDGTVRIAITDTAKPADQYAVAIVAHTGALSISAASAALWGA